MIATEHLVNYSLVMITTELDETRAACVRFIERSGHGAKTLLATQVSCSTETVDRFVDGKEIALKHYLSMRQFLNEQGLVVTKLVKEEQSPYSPASIALDYRCPECHHMTPSPPEAKCCMHCGASLGADCPKCGTWNLPKANLCSACGHPLTEEGARIKLELQRSLETKREKLERENAEKETRRQARKAKSEPEL